MIALVQRVREASVTIDGEVSGEIGPGMLILLGIHVDDTAAEVEWMARKCSNLRIFRDVDGALNRSVVDVKGDALVVSQFTLYGDARKGNRPSFIRAARPDSAEPLYEMFVLALGGQLKRPIATGRFGAMMDVSLVNDGPVTIWIEKEPQETATG